jgi:hypothetical protein
MDRQDKGDSDGQGERTMKGKKEEEQKKRKKKKLIWGQKVAFHTQEKGIDNSKEQQTDNKLWASQILRTDMRVAWFIRSTNKTRSTRSLFTSISDVVLQDEDARQYLPMSFAMSTGACTLSSQPGCTRKKPPDSTCQSTPQSRSKIPCGTATLRTVLLAPTCP